MGQSFVIACAECDYKKELMLGVGMMYSPAHVGSFDSDISLLPHLIKSKKTLELVKNLLNEKHGRLADNYGHTLYHCSKCGEFYERFFYHIDHENGSFEPTFKCPKCKVPLIKFETDEDDEINIDLSLYPCPKCGRNGLIKDTNSMLCWD
jgi:hypothetical protein